ncbi:hypothetical protein [Halalkalibacter alkalisediminis]|uniref:Spore coat protein n=1 Tax=Halalkalibacter alkalisediminis TaxID=935616 RepID=A0ABV6NNH9_9BACI|nr:hypothetical protein [Halalkalibacter alkalisediminis]
MFPAPLQGIGRFSPVDFGHNFHQRQGHFWHQSGYLGNGYGHFGYQPVYNHGHEYQWHNHYVQHQSHPVQSQTKTHVKHNPHDSHSHHGYSYGQGSGQFPDYYNHNY